MKTNNLLKAILEDRSGGTAIEYGLIAALIVIAMISALNTFANETIGMWSNVETSMAAVNAV
jgi:pilus assembly protein Flp/PilA